MMRRCLIVAVAIVVLTLAFASIAVAGPPPKGSCPDGFVPVEVLYHAMDRNGDGWICKFIPPPLLFKWPVVYIDNVIPPRSSRNTLRRREPRCRQGEGGCASRSFPSGKCNGVS